MRVRIAASAAPSVAAGKTQLRGCCGRRAFAEHLFHGIARNNVNHQKNKREHQPQCGQGKQKTLKELTKHRKEIMTGKQRSWRVFLRKFRSRYCCQRLAV